MKTFFWGALAGTIISALIYVVLGLRDHRRSTTAASYFFDDWSLDGKLIGATLFSSAMSLATVVITLLQLGITFGIAIMWATITFCAGWFVLGRLAPIIHQRAQREDTIHSFIGKAFGSVLLGKIASVATILGLLGLFATELLAAESVLKALCASEVWTIPTVIFVGIVTIVYSALGGFRSAVRSDWIQTGWLMVSLLLLVYLTFELWFVSSMPSPKFIGASGMAFLPAAVAWSIFFINVPFPFVDMQVWQRLIAAKSSDDFVSGNKNATIAFAVSWTILIILSLVIAACIPGGADPLTALFEVDPVLRPTEGGVKLW